MIFYISNNFLQKILAGIYIHIPYCNKRCIYCDFHFTIAQKNRHQMIKSIQKEIQSRNKYLDNQEVNSVYFGGGTPSVLNASEIKSLITKIYKSYRIRESAEITIECNPEDLTERKLQAYKNMGINRLSIGVQSFNDTDLEFMNRSHSAQAAIKSIQLAKKIGFKNITIDLIYGIPNQKLKNWEYNLDTMFGLNIKHFSAYILTAEKKTMLHHLIKNKKIQPLNDKKIISQFNLLQKKAKKSGFIHYEISNFSKEGYFSKHNTSYWKNKNYLGIGPSAHSYNGVSRRWNISSNTKYISNIKNNLPYFELEKLSPNEQYNEYIFLSLRTIWGIDKNLLKKIYGEEKASYFLKKIKKWEARKYVNYRKNIYTLSSSGKMFADLIASDLFIVC